MRDAWTTARSELVKVWVHPDGRIIAVHEDHKVRYINGTRSAIRPGSLGDEWPVLWRTDVPNLTDEQWEAAPDDSGEWLEKKD